MVNVTGYVCSDILACCLQQLKWNLCSALFLGMGSCGSLAFERTNLDAAEFAILSAMDAGYSGQCRTPADGLTRKRFMINKVIEHGRMLANDGLSDSLAAGVSRHRGVVDCRPWQSMTPLCGTPG
jgi:hypothetical protein